MSQSRLCRIRNRVFRSSEWSVSSCRQTSKRALAAVRLASFMLVAFVAGCGGEDATGSVWAAPSVERAGRAALASPAPRGAARATLVRDVVAGLRDLAVDHERIQHWVESDPLADDESGRMMREFRDWLLEAASWPPEMFTELLLGDEFRTLPEPSRLQIVSAQPPSKQLRLVVEGLCRTSAGTAAGSTASPVRLASGMDPLNTFDRLFGGRAEVVELLDRVIVGYPRAVGDIDAPRAMREAEWQLVQTESARLVAHNRKVIERAIRVGVSNQRRAQRPVSLARIYAGIPAATARWIGVGSLVDELRVNVGKLDDVSKRLFETIREAKRPTPAADRLRDEQGKLLDSLRAGVVDVDAALTARLDSIRRGPTAEGAWSELRRLAERATRLYSLTGAEVSVEWPGSAGGAVHLVVVPDEGLAETARAGAHLVEPVRIVSKGGELDVARLGAGRLLASTPADVLAKVGDGLPGGVEQSWQLDFGLRVEGVDWTLDEAIGEDGTLDWQLRAAGLGGAVWTVDRDQFTLQARSLGLSPAVAASRLDVRLAEGGPIVECSLFVPALGNAPASAASFPIELAGVARGALREEFIRQARIAVSRHADSLAEGVDLPALRRALGGRRVEVRSVRRSEDGSFGFVVHGTLRTAPPLPVELHCRPLGDGALAVVRVEAPRILARSLLGEFAVEPVVAAATAWNEAAARAHAAADAVAEVVLQNAPLLEETAIAELEADLRARLRGALRAATRATIDDAHRGVEDALGRAARKAVASVLVDHASRTELLAECSRVASALRSTLAQIASSVDDVGVDQEEAARISQALAKALVDSHSELADRIPDLTATVREFVRTLPCPPVESSSVLVGDDDLARLGRSIAACLMQDLQRKELDRAKALAAADPSSDEDKNKREERGKFEEGLDQLLPGVSGARTFVLEGQVRADLMRAFGDVLVAKRDAIKASVNASVLEGIEKVWLADDDVLKAIESIVRSSATRDADAMIRRLDESLRLTAARLPAPRAVVELAEFRARMLVRGGREAVGRRLAATSASLTQSIAVARSAVRETIASASSDITNVSLDVRIEVDGTSGPRLNVRGVGRVALPNINLDGGFEIEKGGAIFAGGSEVRQIAAELRALGQRVAEVNDKARAIIEGVRDDVLADVCEAAHRRVLDAAKPAGEDLEELFQEVEDAIKIEGRQAFAKAVDEIAADVKQRLQPVADLAGAAEHLNREVKGLIAGLGDDAGEAKANLEALLPRLEGATTPELLSVVRDFWKVEGLADLLNTGETQAALQSLRAAFAKAAAEFPVTGDAGGTIGSLLGLAAALDDSVVALPLPMIEVDGSGLKAVVAGLPDLKFVDPRLQEVSLEELKGAIAEQKQALKAELTTAKDGLVDRAKAIRDEAMKDVRAAGRELLAKIEKALPKSVSVLGTELAVKPRDNRVELVDVNAPAAERVLFAVTVTHGGSISDPPRFRLLAPVGNRLTGRFLALLDAGLRDVIGLDDIRVVEARLFADGRFPVILEVAPDGLPVPLVVEIDLRFRMPEEGKWEPVSIDGVRTNAGAALSAAVNRLVKKLVENAEPLGIGPLEIATQSIEPVFDDDARPFRGFGFRLGAKLKVTEGLHIPVGLELHSRRGLKVRIDETAIAAVAGKAVNELLGDSLPLGLKLDTPAFSLDGGLRVFCLFKVEVPGLGVGLGGRFMLSGEGIDFGEAIRLRIPGWYDSPPVSFGGLGASLDVKQKVVSVHASVSISPGAVFHHLVRADLTGSVAFGKPVTLRALGEVKLLSVLTLAESRVQLVPERGSFEIDSWASLGNVLRFEGLFFIEAIHAREVSGRRANIFAQSSLALFGLKVSELEAGMNWDLELWASTHLDLAIARVEAEFGFAKGLSSPRLSFRAGIDDETLDDVVDIDMYVVASADYVGADVTFKLLGIPAGVYLEFGSLRDLTPGEVLRRLADLIHLELAPPTGLKIVPGGSREVEGRETNDLPTTTKDEGTPEEADKPKPGAIPEVDAIPPFHSAWKVVPYVVVEKKGGLLGTGLFGGTRKVKKYRADVVHELQGTFGSNGHAFQSSSTYYKRMAGHVLTIDAGHALRVYREGNASPAWTGAAKKGGPHQDVPAGLVGPADAQIMVFLVAPPSGTPPPAGAARPFPRVLAAKPGAVIGPDIVDGPLVVDLSAIEVPDPDDRTSKRRIDSFDATALASDGLRDYVRLAAMLRFLDFTPKALMKLADELTWIRYHDGSRDRTLLYLPEHVNEQGRPDGTLIVEDLSENPDDAAHQKALAANVAALNAIPVEPRSTLTPQAMLRSVGSGGAWARALAFTEGKDRLLVLIGEGKAITASSAGSWSVEPAVELGDVLQRLDRGDLPGGTELTDLLNKAQPGTPLQFGLRQDSGGNKLHRMGLAYAANDGARHVAFMDRLVDNEAGLADLSLDAVTRYWTSRSVLVPEGERGTTQSDSKYLELLLEGKWEERGWRANPLGPFFE